MTRWPLVLLGLLLAAAPGPAQDMSGSEVALVSPSLVNAGDAGVLFTFYVYNGSPDAEWTRTLTFSFPACFTVTGGSYDDGGLGWVFFFAAAGAVGSFTDGDGGYGEIYDGDGGYFFLTVDVGADCPAGPATVHWLQEGDAWGADPHSIAGDLGFAIAGTATAPTSWSRLKALY